MQITEHQQKLFLKHLAKSVVERRQELGMSQEKLAEMSGLTRNFISLIERADTNPSILKLLAIASAMDCELESLLLATRSKAKARSGGR